MKNLAPLLLLSLSFSTLASTPSEHPCNEFDAKKHQAERAVNNHMEEAQRAEAKLRTTEMHLADAESQLSGFNNRIQVLSNELTSLESQMASAHTLQQRRNETYNLINVKENQRRDFSARAQREPNFSLKQPLLREAKRLEKEIQDLTLELQRLDQDILRVNNLSTRVMQKRAELSQAQRERENAARSLNIGALQQVVENARQDVNRSYDARQALESALARANFHVEMCYGYIELSEKYPVALETARRVQAEGCRNVRLVNYQEPMHTQAQQETVQKMCSR